MTAAVIMSNHESRLTTAVSRCALLPETRITYKHAQHVRVNRKKINRIKEVENQSRRIDMHTHAGPVCCVAHTVFTSYFNHWSLSKWNSELLIVFLFSPIATITFTNIHLFYDVYLMEHTNCLCLLLLLLFTGIVCSIFFFILIFLYSNIVVFTVPVCSFPCYLMAFDCQELKGLLTYLLSLPMTVTYTGLLLITQWPWPLTFWPYGQCMPRACLGLGCVFRPWCWQLIED